MNIFESIKLALDAIWAHKLRSFLTLLGVIFGVATVIVVVSLIEGFNKYVDEKIANIGTNAFSVQKFSIEDFSSLDNYEQARRRNKDVTMDDLDALRDARGGAIKDVGGQEETQCELKYGTQKLFGVSLQAITANVIEIQNKDIAEGRPFTQAEEMSDRAVCFIGSDVADRFFPTRSPVGQRIKIDGRPFEVVGVAKSLGTVFGVSRDKFVSVPLTTFMNIYAERRQQPARKNLRHNSTCVNRCDFDLAHRRRHRDHEHHAGQRDRADERDRRPQKSGRAPHGHP